MFNKNSLFNTPILNPQRTKEKKINYKVDRIIVKFFYQKILFNRDKT